MISCQQKTIQWFAFTTHWKVLVAGRALRQTRMAAFVRGSHEYPVRHSRLGYLRDSAPTLSIAEF
jgi:hypothetical protein